MTKSGTHGERRFGPQAGSVVVSLGSYRLARRAADVLAGLLHGASFVTGVVVEVSLDGKPTVVATVARRTGAVAKALPRSIDTIPVEVRAVRGAR